MNNQAARSLIAPMKTVVKRCHPDTNNGIAHPRLREYIALYNELKEIARSGDSGTCEIEYTPVISKRIDVYV